MSFFYFVSQDLLFHSDAFLVSLGHRSFLAPVSGENGQSRKLCDLKSESLVVHARNTWGRMVKFFVVSDWHRWGVS